MEPEQLSWLAWSFNVESAAIVADTKCVTVFDRRVRTCSNCDAHFAGDASSRNDVHFFDAKQRNGALE